MKGTYSPAGVKDCIPCGVGHYCPSDGSHQQSPCAIGWYATSPGSDKCLQCDRGMVQVFFPSVSKLNRTILLAYFGGYINSMCQNIIVTCECGLI